VILERKIPYVPLPSQGRFHSSTARFKGFSGPIGSGKSQALCQEAIRLTYLNQGRTGLIGAPTYPMLRDATQTALFETLAAAAIPFEFNKAEMLLTLTDTGSRVLLRSLDEYERLRGTNLAWFGVDELTYCLEEAWSRLEGRLRDPQAKVLCGFAVWTPKGYDWVWRKWVQESPQGYECIQARPFENRHLLDAIPDFYERLRGSYDETFFAQEVLGQYLNPTAGLVYPAFDRTKNVREVKPQEGYELLWALDFNVNPMTSIVAQAVDEEVRVVDEIVMNRASTFEACDEFVRRYGGWEEGIVVFADATSHRMQTAGTSDREMVELSLRQSGVKGLRFRIPKSNPGVRDRVALVNGKLRAACGEVGILIDPRCKELIADFERVQWSESGVEIDKSKDPRRSHASDALGYMLWQVFQPKPRIGMGRRRLL
jgi:hypothetical protein